MALPNWYVRPAEQAELITRLLAKNAKLNFKPSGFDLAEMTIPRAPRNFRPHTKTEVLMLDLKFPDLYNTEGWWSEGESAEVEVAGLQMTMQLWNFLIMSKGPLADYRLHCSPHRSIFPYMDDEEDPIRAVPGYPTYEPGVRWVAFDPCAYQGLSPNQALRQSARDGARLAGTEVLLAAMLFPKWVLSWGGQEGGSTPCPYMGGLQARRGDRLSAREPDWSFTPAMWTLVADGRHKADRLRDICLSAKPSAGPDTLIDEVHSKQFGCPTVRPV